MSKPRFCACGCGGETAIPQRTDTLNGRVKDRPNKYIHGHFGKSKRSKKPDYIVDPYPHPVLKTPCWRWNRQMSGPYGKKGVGSGRKVWAHRFYYEKAKGQIPEGFHVDHLCEVQECVNPGHLEAVKPLENYRRRFARPEASYA